MKRGAQFSNDIESGRMFDSFVSIGTKNTFDKYKKGSFNDKNGDSF